MSKKVLVAADGTASSTDATIGDIFTTLFSADSAVTGTYGLVQKLLLVGSGAVALNLYQGRGWNIFAR